MRDGGYNGYVHGVFMFIVFTAVACGGAGQVQYVSLKVCEEMSAQSNATRETYSNYSFSTSLSPEEMAIALHAPSQSLGTWTPSAAPPHRLSADQHLGNVTLNCTRPDVGATTARVLQMLQLVSSLPGIVVTGSMGVLSDTYGRKPILLLGLLALFASTVVSLIAVWLDWSYWWIVIAQGISGLTGNYVVILLAIFASVSDISTGSSRTVNIALAEGGVFIGSAAGFAAFGQFTKHFPFAEGGGWRIMLFASVLLGVAVLWAAFGMKESLLKANRVPFPGLYKANTVASVMSLTRNRTTTTLAFSFCLQCCTYFGYLSINQVYAESFFRWKPERLAYSSMMVSLCSGFGMLAMIPLLGAAMRRWITPNASAFRRDKVLLVIAVVLGIGQYIGYGLIPSYTNPKSKWLSFAISSANIFTGVQPPVMRAMFSKQFSARELGVVFGGIATLEATWQLIWPIVVDEIYRSSFKDAATEAKWHGSLYFFGAGLAVLSFFALLSLPSGTKEVPINLDAPAPASSKMNSVGAGDNSEDYSDDEPLLAVRQRSNTAHEEALSRVE